MQLTWYRGGTFLNLCDEYSTRYWVDVRDNRTLDYSFAGVGYICRRFMTLEEAKAYVLAMYLLEN